MYELPSISVSLSVCGVVTIFNFSQSVRCAMVSHWGFDVHFADGSFHVGVDFFLFKGSTIISHAVVSKGQRPC